MKLSGLRLRIAAAIAASSIVIVIACGAALYMASEKLEFELAHQLISEELGFLISRHQANPAFAPGSTSNVQYFIARDAAERASLPAYVTDLPDGQHELDVGVGRGERHIAVRTIGPTRYAVVYDIGPYEDRELGFQKFVAALLAVVVVTALVLGYWLAGMLTRQLTLLARRVTKLVPGEEPEALARPDQDREVAVVAQALDQYRAQMSALLQREQDFTANASHELRTPLTAVKTSCQVVLKKATLPPDMRMRIDFIQEAADQMSVQVEALLFLARGDTPGDRELFTLRECVLDAAAPLRAEIARKRLELEIAVPEDAVVETNRQALYLVISNLVRNAIAYTDEGVVRVGFDSGRLVVRDSGVGIHPEHLSRIFERHFRGTGRGDGSGIGLDIVKRISDRMGWTVAVHSVLAAGSEFMVTLTPQTP